MPNEQKRFYGRIGLALIFVAVLSAFFAIGGNQWLSLEFIKENRDRLLAFTEQNYALMLFASAFAYLASTAFSIPGGVILSLAMGLLFGRWLGTLVTVIASTVGALLVFLAARFIFADFARAKLSQSPMAAKIVEGFQNDAFRYLLFLRLVPLVPFWLVNLAPTVTNISARTYFLATAIGVIPGSFVYVNLGQALGEISNIEDILSPEVILSFTLLGLLIVLPALLRRNDTGPRRKT
ncbi:TVP38/TMEM64 family protein [Methylocaldum sp.]|uniref:TVP38/TMEM64 family protein n=1 Tax=Methylocaldum sp. TaxID=1969727 RepID=UPI002D4CFECB|nr:TVP38/TMEM64 family protein [Methylocaldum sp.]HYE34649.1 TVP38/TMEM64 family protein [Methylocaldum sp.]